MWQYLSISVLIVAVLAEWSHGELIVDDFTSGLFAAQAEDDTDERIMASQSLSGVFASNRRVWADDIQIEPGSVGVTSISVEGDGLLRFHTDYRMELLNARWTVPSFDATEVSTRFLVFDFSEFATEVQNQDGHFAVYLGNGLFESHRVGEIEFHELLGGASVAIALDEIPPDDTFDLTQVDQIVMSTTSQISGSSFELRSVTLIPEPSGFALFLLATMCFCRRCRP
jgi:hypothetical protein